MALIPVGPYFGWPLILIPLALSPVGLYSGLTENGLALVPLALSPVGLYFGFAKNGLAVITLALSSVGLYSELTENGLALITLALSPVGLYSGFAKNGLALIPVALFPVSLSPVGPYSNWPLVLFTIFAALALIPLALSPRPRHGQEISSKFLLPYSTLTKIDAEANKTSY